MPSVWNSLAPPWQVCLEEAWMAYCTGSVPIGAAVTDAAGRLLARDRNRSADTERYPCRLSGTPLAHAELNVLAALDLQSIDPHTATLYSTTEPCPLCLGAIYMSGLRECRFASRDPYAGSANLLGATPYLSRKPVRLLGPLQLELELTVMSVYVESAISSNLGPSHPVFDEIGRIAPQALSRGLHWKKTGRLHQLRQVDFPASQVWEELFYQVKTSSEV